MRTLEQIKNLLIDPGVIAVIRLNRSQDMLPLCRALMNGGIIALEITLTTPDALKCIRAVSEEMGKKAIVGAGSVTSGKSALETIEAGAEFVVSPICKKEIAEAVHSRQRPVMLGAYTPTEAQTAFEAGADFVKIFPADQLGPGYIKSLRAPLPHLQVVPTGGVDLKSIGDFFKAGCAAVGAGSSLLVPQLIENQNWDGLAEHARTFVQAAAQARKR